MSTQNGIPWWYFQGHGGELDGAASRARRSRAASSPRAIEPRRVVGIAGLLRHRHRRARRHPAHRGQSHQLRRAGRHRVGRVRAASREALIAAGFRCPVTTRIRHEIWVKLLGNVAFNPISALTGGTLEELARHPDVSALVRRMMAETEAVAGRLGHRAADLDRSADGRRREGGRAQDVDAAGLRGRAADGARSRRRRGGRAGRPARRADAGDAGGVCLCVAAQRPYQLRAGRTGAPYVTARAS